MILRNPRFLLGGGGILILAVAAASLRFFSAGHPLEALTSGGLNAQAASPALEADDVQVIGRGGGTVHWRLTARHGSLSRDRRVLIAAGVRRATLYADGGKRTAGTLSADTASYSSPFGMLGSAGQLQVSGHVRATVRASAPGAKSPQTAVFQTSLLTWDTSSNILTCPSAVSATLPKLSVVAGSAQYQSPPAKPASGVLTLGAGVHADFSSNRGQATLSCAGLIWNAAASSARTVGPVSVTIPGGLGTASADDITVSTRTGDLSGHGLRGTLRLAPGVQ